VPVCRVLRVARRAAGTGPARNRRPRGRPSRRPAGARCFRWPGRARGERGPGLDRCRAAHLCRLWQGKARNGAETAPASTAAGSASPSRASTAAARWSVMPSHSRLPSPCCCTVASCSTASAPGRSPFRARLAAASDRARPRMGSKAPAQGQGKTVFDERQGGLWFTEPYRVCGPEAGRGRQRWVPDVSGYLDRLHGGPPRRRAVSGVGPGHQPGSGDRYAARCAAQLFRRCRLRRVVLLGCRRAGCPAASSRSALGRCGSASA
jgi:hypothetical protein